MQCGELSRKGETVSRLPRPENLCFGLYDCCALEVELGWSRQDAFAYSNKGRLAAKPSPGDAGDGWEGNTRKTKERQAQGG